MCVDCMMYGAYNNIVLRTIQKIGAYVYTLSVYIHIQKRWFVCLTKNYSNKDTKKNNTSSSVRRKKITRMRIWIYRHTKFNTSSLPETQKKNHFVRSLVWQKKKKLKFTKGLYPEHKLKDLKKKKCSDRGFKPRWAPILSYHLMS